MLLEGVPAPSIEQASSQAGYPAPVLQLTDELNMNLLAKVREENKAAGTWTPHPSEEVIDRMLERGRGGRLAGAGFYDYADGKRTGLWSGLREFGGENHETPFEDLKERMLFIEALETVKCLDEGVIESVADANIGSILGIGFPGWTGGVLQYMNGYAGGLPGFVTRARELAEQYGERFEPPASLVERAERGEPYTDSAAVAAAA
jgi:3-hydroxyacyl-CoA dehydrogenase/enoyl-CoA hydratase/3-hydroxybutyryl-CoA epimerase